VTRFASRAAFGRLQRHRAGRGLLRKRKACRLSRRGNRKLKPRRPHGGGHPGPRPQRGPRLLHKNWPRARPPGKHCAPQATGRRIYKHCGQTPPAPAAPGPGRASGTTPRPARPAHPRCQLLGTATPGPLPLYGCSQPQWKDQLTAPQESHQYPLTSKASFWGGLLPVDVADRARGSGDLRALPAWRHGHRCSSRRRTGILIRLCCDLDLRVLSERRGGRWSGQPLEHSVLTGTHTGGLHQMIARRRVTDITEQTAAGCPLPSRPCARRRGNAASRFPRPAAASAAAVLLAAGLMAAACSAPASTSATPPVSASPRHRRRPRPSQRFRRRPRYRFRCCAGALRRRVPVRHRRVPLSYRDPRARRSAFARSAPGNRSARRAGRCSTTPAARAFRS